jgi:RNA polymerase sigma-70 factor (ECF subfamily)
MNALPVAVPTNSRRVSDATARSNAPRGARLSTHRLALVLAEGEATWVAGIRAGDAVAFEAMFRTYYGRLHAFAREFVYDAATVDELVQDVLCWVWQHRETWVVDTSLKTYLFGAVRNRALNHVRRERLAERWERRTAADRLARPEMLCAEPADARVVEDDFTQALRCTVARLPERCQEAYRLRWHHHLSYREVAEQMGTSVKTVEIQIAKALKMLRQGLAEFF